MRKTLLTIIFGLIFYSCSSSKIGINKTKYFDENNIEISKSRFNKIRSKNKVLDIIGDSINHKKLTLREKRGKIANRALLESLLEKEIKRELDLNTPLLFS